MSGRPRRIGGKVADTAYVESVGGDAPNPRRVRHSIEVLSEGVGYAVRRSALRPGRYEMRVDNEGVTKQRRLHRKRTRGNVGQELGVCQEI